MTRKVCSALVGIGLCVGLMASGQEPPAPKKDEAPKAPPAPMFVPLVSHVVKDLSDGLAEAIAKALQQHPDVRLAEAKRQVADAELAQAKLLVTQRVTTAHTAVQRAKMGVVTAEQALKHVREAAGPGAEVRTPTEDQALATAKANLAAAEADFRAAVGAAGPVAADAAARHGVIWLARPQAQGVVDYELAVEDPVRAGWALRKWVLASPPAPGTPAEKLRGLVDKTVKLDQKPLPFSNAMAEFVRAAGLTDLTIRYPDWATAEFLHVPPKVPALRGEHTAVAWLQMMVDDFNRAIPEAGVPEAHLGRYEAYVREYGLLITKTDLAPPGAVTLSDFARQVRAEKAAEGQKPKTTDGAEKK